MNNKSIKEYLKVLDKNNKFQAKDGDMFLLFMKIRLKVNKSYLFGVVLIRIKIAKIQKQFIN